MKILRYSWIFCLVISCSSTKNYELSIEALSINAQIKGDILDGESVLNDPDRFVWGGSVVKGDDGKYHMLYSTWESGDSIYEFSQSWVLHSKIAYAVSNFPDRGFKFQKVVLQGAALDGNPDAWDAQMVHNPHLKKFGDTYYLYYIGSKDPGKQPVGSLGENLSKRNRVQQSQMIGVIPFKNFEDLVTGNFNRPIKPLLKPRTRVKKDNVVAPSPFGTIQKPDNLIVVNPSVERRPSDGKYLLFFKGNIYDPNWRGVHGVAISDTPTGSFKALDNHVFDIKLANGKIASAEDPYVWYHKKHDCFYAVFKDFSGKITDQEPGLALLKSDDGIAWIKPENPFFMKKQVKLKTGEVLPVVHLERPQLLFSANGDPTVLYAACSTKSPFGRSDGITFNVQIPLEVKTN
jgi:hypothetical protein